MTGATAISPNVIHEAIDERQFVRTKIPAQLVLTASDGTTQECEIQDISLGGVGLLCKNELPMGGLYKAAILLQLNAIDLTIDAKVKIVSQRGEQIGAEFVDLDNKKRDILRYIMACYMSGEIVDINGLFNVMQRENYIKERKQKSNSVRTPLQRFQAALGSLAYLTLGLAAVAFVGYKTYLMLFRIPASQALVSAESYIVSMPDNGYLTYNLQPGQTEVRRGEPLATVSTQLASSLNTPSDIGALSQLSQADLQIVLGRSLIETVIASPCDCEVYYPGKRMDGYAYKQDQLIHLIPKSEPLYVRASVPFGKLEDIRNVSSVRMSVYGIDEPIGGEIVSSSLDPQTQMLVLNIKPEQSLPLSAYQKPVAVDLFLGLPGFRN